MDVLSWLHLHYDAYLSELSHKNCLLETSMLIISLKYNVALFSRSWYAASLSWERGGITHVVLKDEKDEIAILR